MIRASLLLCLTAFSWTTWAQSDDDVIQKLEESLDKGMAPPAGAAPVKDNHPEGSGSSSGPVVKGAPGSGGPVTTGTTQAVENSSGTPSAPNASEAPPTSEPSSVSTSNAAPPADPTAEIPTESFQESTKTSAAPPSTPTTPAEEAPPEEIRALEKALKAGNDPDLPTPLYEPAEPGGTLKPSDRFFRIPLKPRMSDANWRRWAGPMLEKSYRIRHNDSLWGISERLFGNPYLWPKVWQLNAQIPNPHIIQPNIELSFNPGNPNSAPALAFKTYPGKSAEELPLMTATHKMSFMEFLDENLRAQILSSHPPFQYFFLDEKPQVIGVIPKPENPLRIFHDEGDGFMSKRLSDGEYSIIRIRPMKDKFYNAYKVRWLGTLKVQAGRATVAKAFAEVSEGDQIVAKAFTVSPLALYEYRMGSEDRNSTELIPVQEGYETLASESMLIGIRFPGIDRGPRTGALMTVSQGAKKVATLLLIDRDHRLGTAWVVEGVREIDSTTDKID